MPGISLYIHIPFCIKKCAYCDFVSFPNRQSDFRGYIDALEDELKRANTRYGKLDVNTVFIGGGTPSVLPSDDIMRLLAMCRRFFHVLESSEITIEANPGSVDIEKLKDYRASGVNRLSLGMQSSSDRLLKLIGRVHSNRQTVETVGMAREAGFENINLDLIYALPTQTMREWIESVKGALAMKPSHLSLYNLIVEDGTPIAQSIRAGEISELPDDAAVDMRAAAGRILSRQGYSRYEISNYCKTGSQCRHNITYWNRGEYLGVGCAAHSFMRGDRFCNTSVLDDYLNGVREISRETIDADSAREEAIMLGTRMTEGIDLSLVKGKEHEIEQLRALGLVDIKKGRLSLTDKGMDVQNAVVIKLI